MQGGNRLGTERKPGFTKIESGSFHYVLGDKTGKFQKTWHGDSAGSGNWDPMESGNQKIFGESAGTLIPKGDYVLEFLPKWKKFDEKIYKGIKDVTIRVLSHSKVGPLKSLTKAQAVDILTGSKAEISFGGKNCEV